MTLEEWRSAWASIEKLVGPFMWVVQYEQAPNWDWRLFPDDVILRIIGMAKPSRGVLPSPSLVRHDLYSHAESAIAALERAGFEHFEHPKISFDGKVTYRVDTAGKAHLTDTACSVELTVRLPRE